MAKRRNEWRARILRSLHQSDDSGVAPFCLAVTGDLWSAPGTRNDFPDPYDVFTFLEKTVAGVPALQLGSGTTTRVADAVLDESRAIRGDLRENLRWLGSRPQWADALERHAALLPQVSWWTSAVRDLLLLLHGDPSSPDLDSLPPELRRAAELRQARLTSWRTDLARHVLGETEADPGPWMVAVVELLWDDERVRNEFPHAAMVGERLLEMLAYSAAAFIDYRSPDEGDETEGEDDETLAEPGDLSDVHPKALEALLSLNDDLIYLRRNPGWMDAMNQCADLLPEGRWSDALACLEAVVEQLDETTPKPSPSRGGTYFGEETAEARQPSFDARPQRITIGDYAYSAYMRKHWRREIRRQEGVSEALAEWIATVAEDLSAEGEGGRGETGGPHLVALQLVGMILASAALSARGGALNPVARTALQESAEFLAGHPAWREALARHVESLEDAAAREAVLALLSQERIHELLREPDPIRPGRWREDLRQLFQGSRFSQDAMLAFLSAVAGELWADPRTREEFGEEGDVAGHLMRMVADAGIRYVAPRSMPSTRSGSLLMDFMEQRARSTLQADTLEWLAQRPFWLASMERHSGLLGEDEAFAAAVAELVREARAHELKPVRGPAATGDWRSRVVRHVSRMGLPSVGPFFVGVVERIWSSPAARSGFTDEFEVFEKTQEVITVISTAFVLPGIAADYPELKVALESARDPGPARERARTETIPWLRSHPEWVSAMRALVPSIPRDNLFRLYVEATVQAGSRGVGRPQRKQKKRK
jgi:hypothetical protein